MLDRCVFLFTKTLVRPPGTVVPGGRIFYCWCFFCLLLGFAGLYHIRAASADSRETLNMTGSVWTQATSVPKLGGGVPPTFLGQLLLNQTQQRSICSRIRDRRLSICGHVRRLRESAPAHEALRLVVNTRAGHRPDDRPEWKRSRGRPRQTWIHQLEVDVGLTADAAWDMANDREVWSAQRPVAGQAVHSPLSECFLHLGPTSPSSLDRLPWNFAKWRKIGTALKVRSKHLCVHREKNVGKPKFKMLRKL